MSKLAKYHSTITKKIVGPSTAKAITNEIGGSIMSVNIININIFSVLLSWEIIPSIIRNRFSSGLLLLLELFELSTGQYDSFLTKKTAVT